MIGPDYYEKYNYYAHVDEFTKVSQALEFLQTNYTDLNIDKIKLTNTPETISIVSEKGVLKDLFACKKIDGIVTSEHIDLRKERNKDLYKTVN